MSVMDKVIVFKNVLNTVLKIVDVIMKCLDYILTNTEKPEV